MVARKAARKMSMGQATTAHRENRPLAYMVIAGALVTEVRPPTPAELYTADLVIVVDSTGFVVVKDRYGGRDRGPVSPEEALSRVEDVMQLHREPFWRAPLPR